MWWLSSKRNSLILTMFWFFLPHIGGFCIIATRCKQPLGYFTSQRRSIGLDATSFPKYLGGFPFFPVAINNEQEFKDPNVKENLTKWVEEQGTKPKLKNIWVISHGLNTEEEKALNDNYKKLFENVRTELKGRLSDCDIGVVGIFWPSVPGTRTLLLASDQEDMTNSSESILETIEALKELAAPEQEASLSQAEDAIKTLMGMSPSPDYKATLEQAKNDFVSSMLAAYDEDEIVYNRAQSVKAAMQTDDFVLNMTMIQEGNFEQMEAILKANLRHKIMVRAAKTGIEAVSPLLDFLQKGPCPLIHLVGHSFGGLLVAACANKSNQPGSFASMTLLQGAFSHNSYAYKMPKEVCEDCNGMFRNTIETKVVAGPIVVTNTKKDMVLGRLGYINNIAKPGEEVGVGIPGYKMMDKEEKEPNIYSAIGFLGARRMRKEEYKTMTLKVGERYDFATGKVNNCETTALMPGALWTPHTNVWNAAVANLIIEVVRAATK